MQPIINIIIIYSIRATLALLLTTTILILSFLALQIHKNSRDAPRLSHIPWTGLSNTKIFPKLRACLRELVSSKSMLEEGYTAYGRQDKPFVLPGLLWNSVILPPLYAPWFLRLGDGVVSAGEPMDELMSTEHVLHGPSKESVKDFTVIRRDLTRHVAQLTGELWDEVTAAFEEGLEGVGQEWTDVKLHKVLMGVAFRAGNRVFVGKELCRSKAYAKAVDHWTQAFGIATVFTRLRVPFKAVWLRVFGFVTRFLEWRATTFLKERIRRRLRGEENENDMLQWIVQHNASKGDARELEVRNIAGKLILFNIFATGTTGIATGTTLLNLLSHPEASSILEQLQTEASELLPQILEDPRQIRQMSKLDSLIRENLRYQPLTPLVRQVVQPGGLKTPDGQFLPEGTHVQIPVRHIHHDVHLFGEEATTFDPLRYDKSSSPAPSAVQASEHYLTWGLGKHACPGRFFAVHVIKLILGYLLSEFELEPLKEKVKFEEIFGVEYGSENVVVRMRRRARGKSDGGL